MRRLSTERFTKPTTEFEPGSVPFFDWIPVDKLVVDDTYQRDIGKRGAQNIAQIAQNFDWSKFTAVIVAPIEGGEFAVVDGQHRTTAAMLRGQKKVPCQVIIADQAQQAAAYAAVNGNITKTTAHQLFHARVASGDAQAKKIAAVCLASDVIVVRKNLILSKMKVGETQAVGAISKCIEKYGEKITITALQCITRTAGGNPGFVRASIIEALAVTLQRNPDWCESGEKLLRILDRWNWPDQWAAFTETDGKNVVYVDFNALAQRIEKFLTKQFDQAQRKKAA